MSYEVIGISGKAGCGKDYIADHILQPLGYRKISLAWHFKVWLVGKGMATYEEVFVTKPPHVRKMLQLEGTEYGRIPFGEAVWCNTMQTWMQLLNDAWGIDKFVCPDIRFPNEVKFIQDLGGKCIRVQAPKRVAKSGLNAEARAHISEVALDDFDNFDGIVLNDPEHSETTKRQLGLILGEDVHQDEDPETLFDKIISFWQH
jgi:hypothetical protein